MHVDLSGEPDWEPLDIPTSFGKGRSFVSGEPDGDRLRLRYFCGPKKDALLARVWFGPGAEGPPNLGARWRGGCCPRRGDGYRVLDVR